MCGRYKLLFNAEELAQRFAAIVGDLAIEPSYNIAPGTYEPIVRQEGAVRRLEAFWWGLVPQWAKEKAFGARTVNARAETIATRPAFRAAFRYRRCLVPADAYYEWKELPGKRKQPYLFRMASGEPFAFGGLWESWNGPDGELRSFCLITTVPNELASRVHDRMPVIIAPEDYARWLDPKLTDPARIEPLVRTFPAEEMISYPVSTKVSNARHQGPEVAERVPDPEAPEDPSGAG
jgi:putative SOS response-associated peptidase YedK